MLYKDLVDNFHYSPNHFEHRFGYKPVQFVIHRPEGSMWVTHNTITNIKEQVSYHFTIDYNGEIHCYVDPDHTAWHAGKVVRPTGKLAFEAENPNYYTIGISLIGFAAAKPMPIQVSKAAKLMAALSFDYGIKPSKAAVLFHREIRSDKTCPGYHINKTRLTVLYLYHYILLLLKQQTNMQS